MAVAAPSGLPSERSVEDVLAGRLRLRLAGQEWVLPVLTVGQNEEWQQSLAAEFNPLLAEVDSDDATAVFLALAQWDEDLMEFLYAYDRERVLPRTATGDPDPEFRKNVYPHEVFKAVQEVRLAANPTAAFALASALGEMRHEEALAQAALRRSTPTSSSPRRMAGRSRKSVKS